MENQNNFLFQRTISYVFCSDSAFFHCLIPPYHRHSWCTLHITYGCKWWEVNAIFNTNCIVLSAFQFWFNTMASPFHRFYSALNEKKPLDSSSQRIKLCNSILIENRSEFHYTAMLCIHSFIQFNLYLFTLVCRSHIK